MKKLFPFLYLFATCFGFVACSDDDTPSTDGQGGGKPNPAQVFTSGIPKSIGDYHVKTNKNGLITQICDEAGDAIATFSYPTQNRSTNYDVLMEIEEYGAGKVYMKLNQNGFVEHVNQIESDGSKEEWWFKYDAEGHMTQMKRTEGDNEIFDLIYDNGDLIQTVFTPHESNLEEKKTNYIAYTNNNDIKEPIPNKGCVMLFDYTMSVDLDEMEYAYMAGLLGKATKHLPVENRSYLKISEEETITYTEKYEWNLNNVSMPESMVATYFVDGSMESYSDKIYFNW